MLILFLLDRLALCAQLFHERKELHIFLIVLLCLDQLCEMLLGRIDLCHRPLIRVMRIVAITMEKLPIILEHVLACTQLFLLKQQRAFFSVQLFRGLFGADAIEFKALLTQIIRMYTFKAQEVAVHGNGHSPFFSDGVLIISHFADVYGMHAAQLIIEIALCHLIADGQKTHRGIAFRLDRLAHQQLRIEQMRVFMHRAVQHIVCDIIVARIHEDRVTSRPQKGFDRIPPCLILQSDHILKGKLCF